MGISDILATFTGRVVDYFVRKRERRNQDILTFGSRIAIRSFDGKYVQTDTNNRSKLIAREKHVQEWEIFIIVDAGDPFSYAADRPVHYGDKVALKAINNR